MSESPAVPFRVVVHGDAPDAAWLATLRGAVGDVAVAINADFLDLVRAQPHEGDVLLLRANAPLPPHAFERIARALEASGADVVSALTNSAEYLSPAAEGTRVEASDPFAIDAGCWWYGDRAVLPSTHVSPECSVWRASGRAKLRAQPRWRELALPTDCVGAVLDHLYIGDGSISLDGPASPADSRHPPPASPLASLRARFEPIAAARPILAGLDPRPVVLHVVHGWGGGVEAFVRDLAEHDDDHVHLALVARGNYGRKRYGEALELQLPAARFACVARYPLPRPIATTAVHDETYAAVLRELVERHAVDAVVVSSLIGHSLDALTTGKPTRVVLHDYFPLWPVLHEDFGDATRRFDRGELDSALAVTGNSSPFARQSADAWWALRAAWIDEVARAGALLVAPSASVGRNITRIEPDLVGGADAPRITVIPHGFVPFAREPSRSPPPERARPRILVLGRIAGGKGETLLGPMLERITQFADLYLLGPGSSAEAFFGESGVHVELDYARNALPDAIDRIAPDLAVIAASVAETWSYTLTELRALGVPVVATRVGALAERIVDGVDGWLAAPEPDALATTLLRIALDRPGLDAMRERLARHVPRGIGAMVADWRGALALAPHAAPRYRQATLAPRALEAADAAERATRIAARELEQRDTIAEQQRELEARAEWAATLERLSRERTRWAQQLETETHRLAALARERHEAVEAGQRARDSLALELVRESQAHAEERAVSERERARERAELERQRDEVQRAGDEVRATLALVVGSRSWKLTRPLRFAARSARALLAALRFRLRRLLELGKRGHRSVRMRGVGGTLARVARGVTPAPAPTAANLDVPPLPVANADVPLPTVPGSDAPRVSIVIPVYNQFHYTRMCLASIAQHAGALAFEVVVVDDCSSDETATQLAQVRGIRAVRNDENLGFIGACNAGAALARGEFVVFLNNDTAVQDGWLEALVATFSDFPDCGLAGAKLVYPDGRLQEAGGIVFSDGSGWNYGRGEDPADPGFGYVREADYCSGAAIMLRRAVFEQFGGFDTRYRPAYYEDTDLAFRVRDAGLKVYYQPASVVVHFEGVTSGTDTGSGTKRYQLVNQGKFVERWTNALARQPKPGTPIEVAREHRVRGTVLIVDAYVPEPDQDSGSVRLVNLMKLLVAEGWKVVFAPDNRAFVPRYTTALQQLGVEVLHHPWYRDPIEWLARHGARLDAAIVLRHYIAVSYVPLLRQHAPRARVIFDTVDLHYLREQRLAQLNGDADLARAAAKTRAQELELVRECDVTLVVSPVERELLAVEAPGARVEVLSNVHEVSASRHPFAARKDVWFVGGFQHPPNLDAMQWFVREVWPRVEARLPDARFHIVGSKMPDAVRALASERVIAHGHVADLAPFLDGCRIAVAPLRYGAGVKGKVNQSMAHGQPVVATPIAVEGMQVESGNDALVAESPEAFAEAIVALYGDDALWQRLAEGGVRNVERSFSFEAARTALDRILPRRG